MTSWGCLQLWVSFMASEPLTIAQWFFSTTLSNVCIHVENQYKFAPCSLILNPKKSHATYIGL